MDEKSLLHEYNAAQRREYYLRTRKLKGRRPKASQPSKPRPKTKEQQRKDRQRHLEAQVNELKARFAKLQEALALLVKQAKARSGVKTPTKKTDSKSTTSEHEKAAARKKADSKPKTASQKAAEAKAQKKYRSKNEQLADEVKSLNERIKTIQARIAKMKKSGSLSRKTNTQK